MNKQQHIYFGNRVKDCFLEIVCVILLFIIESKEKHWTKEKMRNIKVFRSRDRDWTFFYIVEITEKLK